MHQPCGSARTPNMHLVVTNNHGRRIDAARDEAPRFRAPPYEMEHPPRRQIPRWVLIVALAFSLSLNLGLLLGLHWK